MTRLLYFVNIPRFFMTHRLPLALAAKEAGYDVHVTTADDDREHVTMIERTGLPFHPLPLRQHSTNPLVEARAILAIFRLYQRLKPDIVHHVSAKPIFYGGIAARILRVPHVVSAVSGLGNSFADEKSSSSIVQALLKGTYRLALDSDRCHIIFQNPDDMRLLSSILTRDDSHRHLIRGSGVDMDVFSPQPETEGEVVVLFAGRLMRKKGLGYFLEAAKRLKGRARFLVAGYVSASHPDKVPVEQLEQAAAQGIIEWLGKRDDMPQLLAQSHIFCLPTIYGEGIPKALIEAAACGRAIVATDRPGCREVVIHNENGLLIPANDLDALVFALERLIDDPALRQQMGTRGRLIAEANFSLDYVLRETLGLYQQLQSGG